MMTAFPEADGPNSFDRSTFKRMNRMKSKAGEGSLIPYFFPGTITSLAAFAILIFTTVLAGILIVAPVAGFRPMRAFRFTRTSLPIPGRVKEPAFLVSDTARAATSSMIAEAALLGTTNLLAKWVTIWDLVMGFLAILGSPYGGG
jgi:hypothetical protein